MKEIGGYFELELNKNNELHAKAIKLNSGRNALKYILKSQNISKLYLPVYICNSVLEPLKTLDVNYEFYNVNERFEIVQEIKPKQSEKILYVNYFAMKSKYVNYLARKYGYKLVIDNTQAFFEKPLNRVDTFYSPRKFFGVGDGGYLYTEKLLTEELKVDSSHQFYTHLLGRMDQSASSFYSMYQEAEARFIDMPIKKMSNLTSQILTSIDYKIVKQIRKNNFIYLHTFLGHLNKFDIDLESLSTPFVYPFMSHNDNLRELLIKNKVYIAMYWKEVLDRREGTDIEKYLVKNIVSLPIDQRYDFEDMNRIVKIIQESTNA